MVDVEELPLEKEPRRGGRYASGPGGAKRVRSRGLLLGRAFGGTRIYAGARNGARDQRCLAHCRGCSWRPPRPPCGGQATETVDHPVE